MVDAFLPVISIYAFKRFSKLVYIIESEKYIAIPNNLLSPTPDTSWKQTIEKSSWKNFPFDPKKLGHPTLL